MSDFRLKLEQKLLAINDGEVWRQKKTMRDIHPAVKDPASNFIVILVGKHILFSLQSLAFNKLVKRLNWKMLYNELVDPNKLTDWSEFSVLYFQRKHLFN